MGRRYILIFLLFILLILTNRTFGQNKIVLNNILSQVAFEHAQIGILVKNLSTDEVLMQHQADRSMKPASILKIKTAVDAMENLGFDHRFKTAVYVVGDVRDGILHGDIVLKGFGDPSLGSDVNGAVGLDQMVSDISEALTDKNISCIEGAVVADASFFSLPAIPPGYMQEDMANYYGAGAYGINIQENAFHIVFERNGSTAEIIRFDSLAAQEITAQVTASGYSDQAYAYFHPEVDKYHVKGKIPQGKGEFKIKGAIRNPPLYAAKKLDQLLIRADIEVKESPRSIWTPYSSTRELIWQMTYASPTVYDILKPVLFKSNNLYSQVLRRHLDIENIPDAAGLIDGSGLSPGNRISCKELMSSLSSIVNSEKLESFLQILPENAREGNVKSVLKSRPGTLFIKSGSIGGVRSYMGLHKNVNGEWIGFVCMANELECSSTASRLAWETALDWIAQL